MQMSKGFDNLNTTGGLDMDERTQAIVAYGFLGDIALKADQPEQTRTKQHDLER